MVLHLKFPEPNRTEWIQEVSGGSQSWPVALARFFNNVVVMWNWDGTGPVTAGVSGVTSCSTCLMMSGFFFFFIKP